ncbi:MAG: hypothetical protein K2L07_08425 [Lachnospiraceae bacterium]|nr:hypothetical protein [Lachnospiraceae bacterium]
MTNDNKNTYTMVFGACARTLLNIVFLFLLMEGFTYSYQFSYELFADLPAAAASTEKTNITISAKSSAKDVALLLESTGIVNDRYVFLARTYIGKYNTRIMEGTYILGPGMTPDEICQTICGMQSEETS